ncbi:hypothetical protein CE91St1_42550 [Parabacteroides goldsteinii]|nr:hypothetical protein CE91St1_42550 [Parabacteroides goldsteinii]GKG81481.1 hypothetical protein CE91St2_46730 [Parabacteroides goldsteinii]
MHIMQLYKRKDSRWVFPFLHEKLVGKGVLTAQSSLHRVNEYLKEIGDRLNLPYPLTTYVMRHSWASLMLESGSEIGVYQPVARSYVFANDTNISGAVIQIKDG